MVPDRELSQYRRLHVRLLTMKYATRKAQQMAIMDLLIEALRNAPEELHPIIQYLIHVYRYDEQTLRRIIREIRPEEEETMMSQFAQDIRRKALQEGEAKLLLRMLPRRFGPIPDEISERVYQADLNTIEIWADRVLDAESLEDVFSGKIG